MIKNSSVSWSSSRTMTQVRLKVLSISLESKYGSLSLVKTLTEDVASKFAENSLKLRKLSLTLMLTVKRGRISFRSTLKSLFYIRIANLISVATHY